MSATQSTKGLASVVGVLAILIATSTLLPLLLIALAFPWLLVAAATWSFGAFLIGWWGFNLALSLAGALAIAAWKWSPRGAVTSAFLLTGAVALALLGLAWVSEVNLSVQRTDYPPGYFNGDEL